MMLGRFRKSTWRGQEHHLDPRSGKEQSSIDHPNSMFSCCLAASFILFGPCLRYKYGTGAVQAEVIRGLDSQGV